MTPPDAFVSGIADLLASWGFGSGSPLEGVRSLSPCQQRLECLVQQRQQADVWNVTLMARSSFIIDPSVDEYAWSFKTVPHSLDRNRRAYWKLRHHTVDAVLEGLNTDYQESLQPFLMATSTPTGLIHWISEVYQPLMLVSPSILKPVRRALQVATLLPVEQQEAGRSALQRKLKALEAWQEAISTDQGV